MELIGHRGIPELCPENTLASFALALEKGADALEFDVHLSQNGVPVVIHDPTTDRTTGKKGQVKKIKVQDLCDGKRYGIPFANAVLSIPTLEDVLKTFGSKTFLHIEIKKEAVSFWHREVETKVLDLIENHGLTNVAVSSFSKRCVKRFKKMAPPLEVAWITRTFEDKDLIWLQKHALNAVHVAFPGISHEKVKRIHEAGLKCRVYTINAVEQAKQLKGWNVDGLFTNNSERLFSVCKP